MRSDRLGSTVLYYHLPLQVASGTVTFPCASAAQGDCSNPSPSKDL